MDIRYLLQVLFPYLIILYALDCLVLVRMSHLRFTSRLRGDFNLRRAGVYLTGLLPDSWVIHSQTDSLFVTTRGLYFREIPADERRANFHDEYTFIDFDDLDDIKYDDHQVKVNRRWTVRMSSPAAARQVVQSVRRLVELSQSDRKEEIQAALTRSMDLKAVRAVVDTGREKLYWLQALSILLFINVMIVLPFALIYRPMDLYLGTLVSIITANYLIVLILALAAHWNIFMDDLSGRFHLILHLVLLPVSAMHPVSKLTRELLFPFDHLAAAAVLAPDTLPSLVREELLRITFSRTGSEPKDYTLYWNLRENAVRDLCMKAGLNPVDLLENQMVADGQDGSHCPMCGVQYRAGFDTCNDCGITLAVPQSQIISTKYDVRST
jgi:hypothetical protein